MIEIKKVNDKKDRKAFVEFPLKLYKDNPYFVPPLYMDEMNVFTDKNVYFKTCDAVYYLAYKDGKLAGRISGFIQKQANEKNNENRMRFTRFDCIDDQEVANKLFDEIIKWGKEKGMDKICGPLGFSDLEREGLLIEGFDELSTFEEQYNYPYYQKLIENYGFRKEVDWIESKLYRPKEKNEKIKKIAEYSIEKFGLKFKICKSMNEVVSNYADGIFDCLDICYRDLYGTVDFTDDMKKQMIMQFKILLKPEYIAIMLDENDKVVAFGFCLPSFGTSLNKSGGRLTPRTLVKVLSTINHPKVLDLALVAILPEYQRKGLSACVIDFLSNLMIDKNVEYCETNLNLEDNGQIRSLWRYFDHDDHKRRRSFVKEI